MVVPVNGKAGPHDAAKMMRDARADLGLAVLVAESNDQEYEPVAVVMSVREALETSKEDLRLRMTDLDHGGDPMCPERYVLWARDPSGQYRALHRINAEELE